MTAWCPPLAAALAILAGVVTLIGQLIADQGYTLAEWVREVIQTSNGDGFCWFTPCKGRDYMHAWNPFFSKPICIWQRCSEREWYISFGSERDSLTYLTSEWYVTWKVFSAPTSAHLRAEDWLPYWGGVLP